MIPANSRWMGSPFFDDLPSTKDLPGDEAFYAHQQPVCLSFLFFGEG